MASTRVIWRLYISGPISADVPGVETEEKFARFERASRIMEGYGHVAVNPLKVGACLTEDCNPPVAPVIEGDHQPGYHHTWLCYMRHDIKALVECDGIVMLPEWKRSRGARLEFGIAEQLGMGITYVDVNGDFLQ